MKRSAGWGLLACLGAALVFAFPAYAQAQAAKKTQDLVMKDDAKCTTCHDEADKPQVMHIGKTKHGTLVDPKTGSCTNCHGKSEKHIADADKGAKKPVAVDVSFGPKSKSGADAQTGACLGCHQSGNRLHWQSSTHAQRDVTCNSCHKVHTQNDTARDRMTQTESCFQCHKEQRAQVNRASHHPVVEGKMSCSSCHNVHGDNPKQLVKASTNETCFTCHMEKRGPFVHNHQPVQEDCAICHQPHGTSVPALLKSRPPFLCQQCHSHPSHPGQVAGVLQVTGALTGRSTGSTSMGTMARGCVNCHTNIHGSNSTQNSATVGRFRR